MLKDITGCISEYKKASIGASLFMVGEVMMEVAIPFLVANIVDIGFANKDLGYVGKLGAIMLGLAILGLVFGIISGKSAAIASAGFAKNLRKKMFSNIQSFSFENIDTFSTASLVTRLTTDVSNVQNAYQMLIRLMVRAPIMLLFALLMSFYMNAKLAIVFVVAIPALSLALIFIISRAFAYFRQLFKKYDRLNLVIQENLVGIRAIKAYVREEQQMKNFTQVSDEVLVCSKQAEKQIILNAPIMIFAIGTCMVVSSYLGVKMIIAGDLTTGQLMSLFTYAVQILSSLMMASMVLVMTIMSKASVERIGEVLKEKTTIQNGKNPIYKVSDGSIVFENVDFGYTKGEDKRVLKEIQIQIKAGETVGILGGTGSSKTSLIQLIPRLYDTTKGTVYVGGIDIKDYDLESLRNEVAVVLQKNVLFSGTVLENLRWGNEEASEEEIIRVCKAAQADEFIQKFPQGYHTVLDQGGTNVSGGQKQRLCIARALLKNPKILILDDSTSAVDTATDAKIRSAFASEIPNTTQIIIAQRITSVEHADKIIVLHEGVVNGIGTHEELLVNNQIYQEVYESQTKGGKEDENV